MPVNQKYGALYGPSGLHSHLDIQHSAFKSVVGVLLMTGGASTIGTRHSWGIKHVSNNSNFKDVNRITKII